MFFRLFYNQPLAQASYLIGCQQTDEAIVIDPIRDISQYLHVATSEGLRITHVTETHIHADYVSGTRELAAATGAKMYLSGEGGTDWQYAFAERDGAVIVHDGDVIRVGNIVFKVMHTPGHTPEHISFVVEDTPRAAGPMGIITGDFVFVGDVGRPDLLERAAGVANTMEAGAHALFNSLERFRALPDHLQVWPAHGAGSACGKALGAVPSSTVGYEKLSNWGVAESDEKQFVINVLDGQPEPPRYFAKMKRINRAGPPVLGGMLAPVRLNGSAIVGISPDETWLIDLRKTRPFAEAHIPRSLSIPYNRKFTTQAGSLVPYDVDIVLLAPANDDKTPAIVTAAIHDLALIGLDRVKGWIETNEALDTWRRSGRTIATTEQMTADQLADWSGEALTVIDVRAESEWLAGHIPDAIHIPLGQIADRLDELPSTALVLQCQSGSRSSVAASLLQRLGRTDVKNLAGGYVAWQNRGVGV
jgi:hydroxyacylglutathione hydrolase